MYVCIHIRLQIRYIRLQMLTNSGCDELVTVGVLYKRQTFNDDQWLYKAAQQVTNTHLAITELAFDVYEVKVTATNNEDITSMSSTVVANLMTGMSSLLFHNIYHNVTQNVTYP